MDLEKLSPPPVQGDGPQDDPARTAPEGSPSSSPSNEEDLGNDDTEDNSEDESDGGSSSDPSNQYWIFVDKQLQKVRAKAHKAVASQAEPVEEILRL